ncbi:hypothetical protein ACFSJU_11025 [Paradesertivirga mongoliensis]|uniref:Glycosyltransferase family 61 protein n=1 Tax=Paradesertivirga mongoliensis TaxID=2100740 RepID=A0ABW4ZMI1_9SPHI|nr:hypothetical protein [Pedobacter mongoliensis]
MLKKLLRKIFGLYVRLRFSNVSPELRYFYRDTYYCKIAQIKYFIKDYLTKPKYKTVSFNGEFAPELQFALPHAYWHFKNGTLRSTNSSKFTKELYFFSPEHKECYEERSNAGNYNFEIPRVLYSHDYDMSKWAAVPLKEHYKNEVYIYERPLFIIANRYNMEWDGPPISYFSVDLLDVLVNQLKPFYTIVYNRPRPQNITTDESDIYDMNEYEWLREKHPEVILMEDLFTENKGKADNFNHLQLMVYANSERFISIHGGTATLASYFGGVNIILSKQGPEHHFNCYQKLYPKLGGATIAHAMNDDEVKFFVAQYFLDEQIPVNL